LKYDGENMFGLIDVAAIGVIVASFAVMLCKLRLELRS
jgi:hypothetical protein